MKYYVLCDKQDPGVEFASYEEAQEYCVECQQDGAPQARIVGGHLPYSDSFGEDEYEPFYL